MTGQIDSRQKRRLIRLLTSGGFAATELVVAIGLGAIATLVMASLLQTLYQEMQQVSERISSIEMSTELSQLLNNNDFCGCLFRGRTFNSITQVFNENIVSVPDGYETIPAPPTPCTPKSQTLLPGIGERIPKIPTLTMKKLEVTDIMETSPGSGSYTASLRAETISGKMQLKPIAANFSFRINPTGGTGPSDRPFVGCLGSGSNTPFIGNLSVFARPVVFHCASNTAGDSIFCTNDSPLVPHVAAGAWRTVDLSPWLPASAKKALLKVDSLENSVWLKKSGDPSATSGLNLLMGTQDNMFNSSISFVDIDGTLSFDYARSGTNRFVRVSLLGFME